MEERDGDRIYQMKNRYYKWLTNEVVMKCDSSQIYLYIPKAYEKYFLKIR